MRPLAPRVALAFVCAWAALSGCAEDAPKTSASLGKSAKAVTAPTLTPTRQLRRIYLTLRGREPSPADYARVKSAAADSPAALTAVVDSEIDAALASPDFYEQMLRFGHDWLRVGDYKRGSLEGIVGGEFKGNQAAKLTACATGTMHAGALGHFRTDIDHGDPASLCDDPNATVTNVEPWWAPGTTVQVIGRSGNGLQSWTTPGGSVNDCGRLYMGEASNNFNGAGCGCGPNLLYCIEQRQYGNPLYPRDVESDPYQADAQRRLIFEEPARLFAHVATNDAPLSDLVIGDYTVAPRGLQHMYARWGRMNSDNASFDSTTWWKSATANWDKVQFQSIQPNLLNVRTYTFDPKTDDGAPIGIPSAGVLTQLGPNVWYPRERVRAARWLEIFACRNFTAPDPSIVFTPAFTNDPARGGSCQHCHTTIDPAAIHFKRLEVEEDTPKHGLGYVNLGGVGSSQWRKSGTVSFADSNSPGGIFWYQPYGRWHVSFVGDTFLTPLAPSRIAANADARFIDYLPATESLFGLKSDGTIGPLGFGKLLVQSGEFDKCAVQTVFQRVMGRKLDVTKEVAVENQLVADFMTSGRKLKPLIKALVSSDEFKKGL